MADYLVESALLTHGLSSITDQELRKAWSEENERIVWMEAGKICIGGMEQFCSFRKKAGSFGRINHENMSRYVSEKLSGAFTASGTMRVCEMLGIPFTVTCGMGGLTKNQQEACHDLEALAAGKTSLIATSPKDMFDLVLTFSCLKKNRIPVYGCESEFCSGYLFAGQTVRLTGCWNNIRPETNVLLLKEIPTAERITDKNILKIACAYGRDREKDGGYYHPAVNRKIDELTKGYSSNMQLQSLINNIMWADEL